MPNFIPYDYNQHSMIVINFLDQLIPGTLKELGQKCDKIKVSLFTATACQLLNLFLVTFQIKD